MADDAFDTIPDEDLESLALSVLFDCPSGDDFDSCAATKRQRYVSVYAYVATVTLSHTWRCVARDLEGDDKIPLSAASQTKYAVGFARSIPILLCKSMFYFPFAAVIQFYKQ